MDRFLVIVIIGLVSSVRTCSPEGYRKVDMSDMVKGRGIIAYGRVAKKFQHPYEERAFTVEFDVKCTYKNGPIPSKINISHAGYMNGMCGYKNFTVGQEYIAFLSYYGDEYEQIYDKTMEAGTSMSNLLASCGLHLDYPSDGIKSGHCQYVQEDGCKQHAFREVRPASVTIQPEVDPVRMLLHRSTSVAVTSKKASMVLSGLMFLVLSYQ